MPPDSVRCTRTVQSQTSHSRVFASALHYNSPDCPVCHRTVRCTSGATAIQRNDRLQRTPCNTTVHAEVRAVIRGAPDSEQFLSAAAPDYPVPLEDKASNGLKLPNPNGWVTWLAHWTVSGAPGPYKSKLFTFGFLRARFAIIHRTVRCATGLSDAPSEATANSATVDCNGHL